MKLYRHSLLPVAATASVALLLWACGDDKPESGTPLLQDIAEYCSQNASAASFAIYRENAPDVFLTAPGAHIDESRIKPGESLLITYTAQSGGPDRSGDIALRSYNAINNGVMTAGNIADYPDWDRDEVYLVSIWRAGDKIDMRCRLPYDTSPRRFMLLIDESTATADVPDLYVVHELKEPVESFDRNYYAAFDIAELWSQPACAGVTVHVANSNLPQRSFTFMK